MTCDDRRVLIVAIHSGHEFTAKEVEWVASKRGYIVANPRPLSPEARVTYMDGRPMDVDEDTQLWISDIVVAEYDGQESA